MRCRNCSTVLMATDPECPLCHAPAPGDAPGVASYGEESQGLRTVFGVCGGLVGLALFHMLSSLGGSGSRSGGSARAGGASPLKCLFGLVFLLGGVALLALALIHFWDTWELVQRKPHEVTAAELRQTKDPASLPASWVAFNFEQSKPTGLAVVRRRLGHGGEVEAPYLLVQVGDRWLLTSVAPGFRGKRLVGRLQPLTFPTPKDLAPQLRETKVSPAAVLPYEFNAIDGCASEHQLRYTQVGIFAVLGLLGAWLGLRLVRGGSRTASMAAAPRHKPFVVRPLPQG